MERYLWGVTSIFLICCGIIFGVLQQFQVYQAEHYLGHNIQKVQKQVQGQAMACRGVSHQSIYTCQEQDGLFHQMVVMYYDTHRQIIATDHIVQIELGSRSLGIRKNNQLDEFGADYDVKLR